MEDRTVDRHRRLVATAAAGDHAALQELWRDHRAWLAVILAAHAPARTDVRDLLQEVALTMISKLDTLQDPDALRPWLRRIAVNIARSAGRRHRPMLRLAGDDDEAGLTPAIDPDDAQRSESYRQIMGHMTSLPIDYREPLMLRAIKGMSYRQIAEALELPVTTIETRIARARRMLKDLLLESDDVAGRVATTGTAL